MPDNLKSAGNKIIAINRFREQDAAKRGLLYISKVSKIIGAQMKINANQHESLTK